MTRVWRVEVHEAAMRLPYIEIAADRDEALLQAQTLCAREGDTATVKHGDWLVIRYWRDRDGLQYLEY